MSKENVFMDKVKNSKEILYTFALVLALGGMLLGAWGDSRFANADSTETRLDSLTTDSLLVKQSVEQIKEDVADLKSSLLDFQKEMRNIVLDSIRNR